MSVSGRTGGVTWLAVASTALLFAGGCAAPSEPAHQNRYDPGLETAFTLVRTWNSHARIRGSVWQEEKLIPIAGESPFLIRESGVLLDRWRLRDSRELILDAWGHPIRYACPGPLHGWDVWSCGPDGVDDEGCGDDLVAGDDTEPQ